jgi:cell wall-associated NlpC family hydrolase
VTGPAVIKAVTVAAAAAITLPLLIIVLVTASPAPQAAVGLSGVTALAEAGIPPGGGRPAGKVAATAIAFAKAQLGKPYQWGAAGPDAYDCSGLVYAAYAAAGIRLGRTTYQWRQDGPVVPLSQIQPGDLLFSAGSDGTPANPGHVVMYLGDGQVIQAPQTGQDVQVDPVDLASVVVATRPAGLAANPSPGPHETPAQEASS